MAKPLILVDGSSYLYRAFHALPPLTNSQGEPTGAIKGVINMLRRLQKDYIGSTIAVIFDAKGKTFRDEIYPEYKANRPPMPDDLKLQIQPIYDIIDAMGLPLLMVKGVEADDVIGTLAHQATQQDINVVISTGDKDMAQLVNQHVSLVNTMTETVMDVKGVNSKFGIPPELIIDFLALMGDKVDNIPGVPGVGEKTALALLQGVGGIDQIYQNLDAISSLSFRGSKSMADKLRINENSAHLSYQLATIKTDVALDVAVTDLISKPENEAELMALFQHLEFKTWVDELQAKPVNSSNASATTPPVTEQRQHYQAVFTEQDFEKWLVKLQQHELFAFDTETTSLNYMQAQIVGVSFAIKAGEAAYVPCAHNDLEAPDQLPLSWVLEKLKPMLENPNKRIIGQNLKYDAHVLRNYGIELKGIAFDTMLESYVFNSTATRHDMDRLAQFYLDKKTIHFEEVAGKGTKQLTFDQIPIEQAAPYAAEDADITLQLHEHLWPQLCSDKVLADVYNKIEIPLLPVINRIERNGALIDAKLLGEHSIELAVRLKELEAQAFELAGETFNLGSPKQLGNILFEKLGLPIIKKTPKGAPSTAEDVLQELALDYPLPHILIEHRGLAKLKSTYTDKLPQMIEPATGRIHTSYHQAVTATGRLSSSDPNLQNIPIRNAEGRRIRQAFIAPSGYKIVAADYSQIELRIMAHLSRDEGLLEAFSEGKDIHRATAAEVFDMPLDGVTHEQRRRAKAINFGLIYGMSAFGLAKQLGVGRNDAQQYIDTYFERYPGVKNYMDNTRQQAAEQGYVETLKGRRLYLPEINARNGMRRQAAERTAINAPMQGTAADIIKTAMIDVDQWLRATTIDTKMIMQVHDELVFEVLEKDLEPVIDKVKSLMVSSVQLAVPLLVDVGVGNNWDEAH